MASIYTKDNRWAGIKRNFSPEEVERLRGTINIEYTLAKRGAEKLWDYITRGGDTYINALGALTGTKKDIYIYISFFFCVRFFDSSFVNGNLT